MQTFTKQLILALALSFVVGAAVPSWAAINGDEKNDERIKSMIREGREEYLKKQGIKPYEGEVYTPTEFAPDKARSPQGGKPGKPGKPGGAKRSE